MLKAGNTVLRAYAVNAIHNLFPGIVGLVKDVIIKLVQIHIKSKGHLQTIQVRRVQLVGKKILSLVNVTRIRQIL